MELLQQISAQLRSFTLNAGFLNATFEIPAPPPFEPPPRLVYVNVLWFTSLIISLSTASLSMLVKQWLRAYLAIEHSAPQMRLRVRNFRRPGLEQWKVYEIAATLPMFLQISLGLFFLGLCFFTLSLNKSVGITSTVLVAAWALFLLLTLIAPIFFPRCPYKTTLIITVLVRLRIAVNQLNCWIISWLRPALMKIPRRVLGWTPLHSFMRTLWSIRRITVSEEEHATKSGDYDVGILESVDSQLLDDEVHAHCLSGALQQAEQNPDARLAFILKTLRRRMGAPQQGILVSSEATDMGMLDFRFLSQRTYVATMQAVAAILSDGLDKSIAAGEWKDYMKNAFAILLAKSNFPLPPDVVDVMARCVNAPFRQGSRDVIRSLCKPACDSTVFSHILARLREPYLRLDNMEDLVRSVYYLFKGLVCNRTSESENEHVYVADFISYHQDHPLLQDDAVMHSLISFLIAALRHPTAQWTTHGYTWEVLRTIFSVSYIPSGTWTEVHVRMGCLLRASRTCYGVVALVCSLEQRMRAYGITGSVCICDTYKHQDYISTSS